MPRLPRAATWAARPKSAANRPAKSGLILWPGVAASNTGRYFTYRAVGPGLPPFLTFILSSACGRNQKL